MAIAAIASGAYGLGKTLGIDPISGIQSLFGGSSCSSTDRQKEQNIKQAIQQYLSPSDMRNLVAGMESNVAPTPSEMAHFYVGGDDCKHKNVTSGDQRFLDRLQPFIEQRAREQQQQSQSSAGTPSISTPSAGGSLPISGSNSMLIIGLIGLIITIFAVKGG